MENKLFCCLYSCITRMPIAYLLGKKTVMLICLPEKCKQVILTSSKYTCIYVDMIKHIISEPLNYVLTIHSEVLCRRYVALNQPVKSHLDRQESQQFHQVQLWVRHRRQNYQH